jgi:BASS family bile acid:Na+ symporter
MAEILQTLASLSVLVFVVSSVLAMGLSLTIAQIVGPLKTVSLVVKARYSDTAASLQPVMAQTSARP